MHDEVWSFSNCAHQAATHNALVHASSWRESKSKIALFFFFFLQEQPAFWCFLRLRELRPSAASVRTSLKLYCNRKKKCLFSSDGRVRALSASVIAGQHSSAMSVSHVLPFLCAPGPLCRSLELGQPEPFCSIMWHCKKKKHNIKKKNSCCHSTLVNRLNGETSCLSFFVMV